MLPSKAQRDEAEQNRLDRERDYAERVEADKRAAAEAKAKKLEEQIVKLVSEASRAVLSAVDSKRNVAYLRIEETPSWNADSKFVGEQVIGRLLSLSGPEYKLTLEVQDAGYEDNAITADGGPGPSFWHNRHFTTVKITWE